VLRDWLNGKEGNMINKILAAATFNMAENP